MITSWGRLFHEPHRVLPLCDRRSAIDVITSQHPGLAYGMGRSYGDQCLNPHGTLWTTAGLDRFIDFDADTGVLRCEAGVLLRDIQQVMIPRGWALPVTPGTQFVTVGGAIANDVHGKNHHRVGSFGHHVRRLQLVRTDGSLIECGPQQHADWFAATVGGMGLTGVILTAELQLQRTPGPWLDNETVPFEGLDQFFALADASESGWEYTVSWIDCLSPGAVRGIFLRANASAQEGPRRHRDDRRPLSMPFVPPVSLVNRLTLRPFNLAYYHLQKRHAGRQLVHYQSYFYPLDHILHWNRMYGPRGFFQYQSVIPRDVAADAVAAMLREIRALGEGSFLAVLKTFGQRESLGMLSFPQPGVTLALDFPNRPPGTLRLFERLDAIVKEARGRLYLAKDARMPRDLFEAGYPRHAEFLAYRDPGITSAMSRRLLGS
ncbi:FAD-binding oxidoreductase [Caldimonas thermodepolymerans]|jgi:FAD/FMN-containing dehydrogenases|uniref:FAD-binding oxidoreductase n=1 Tax=Caldimonas thermodepolymerans TaxID=215580 RepID=UPI002490856C|nr:FAD-binding oxidoreductase [Caldimonas thermodepolymerans]